MGVEWDEFDGKYKLYIRMFVFIRRKKIKLNLSAMRPNLKSLSRV